MKKSLIFISIIISLSSLVYGLPPRGCGACYDKLNNMKNIKILTIKEIKGSNRYEIDLLNIKLSNYSNSNSFWNLMFPIKTFNH